MSLLAEYQEAQRGERVARVRRLVALRALLATGTTQLAAAEALGVTQPAVSQQAKVELSVDAETLVEAAAPILVDLAAGRGFTELAVFGSVARGASGPDSDIDLLVRPAAGATIGDLVALQELLQQVLGRNVDVVSRGGLRPGRDDDVLRDARSL